MTEAPDRTPEDAQDGGRMRRAARALCASLRAIWPTLTRVDKSKINTWLAFRNAIAVAVPLSIGIALHKPLAGVAIATGALNVSYSDGRDPYAQRARRMLGWTALSCVSVFVGSVTGSNHVLAILVAAVWAFGAGMLISVSTRMGDLGLNTLVSLLVFAARGAMSLEGAAEAGGLVLLGGLIQTGMALLFWPLRRDEPERKAVARVYRKLACEINPKADDPLTTSLTPINQQTQEVLDALGMDHSLEGERYRLLFDQSDRIRLSVFVLERLRSELQKDAALTANIDTFLAATAEIVDGVAECLESEQCSQYRSKLLAKVQALLEATPHQDHGLVRDVTDGMDALAGQLRAVVRLAAHAGTEGLAEFDREQRSNPWRLHVASWFGTMRANLTTSSSFFRHAVRLSICVAAGDAIGRSISWQRTYWIPMTIAVVLKPDFATTMSRGVLRLSGTYAGLLVATALYHVFPQSAITQLFLVGIFTFMLRSVGPANYGVFTTAVSGLIVFLIAETGIAPAQVVALRALNTTVGGLFALLAYNLWPTWERAHIAGILAGMIEAARNYFQAVAREFGSDKPLAISDLDSFRSAWRKARSAAEASFDRYSAEPGTARDRIGLAASILASSHGLVHCIMGLESEVLKEHARTAPEAFRTFAHDVDTTLYFLAAALNGSAPAAASFPKLREDHTRMLKARSQFSPLDELVLLETDRLTVALNTLREQVTRFVTQ